MSTSITDYGDVTAVTVSEELTGDSVEGFIQKTRHCITESRYNLVIDCSSVTHFDSAGLETLLDLQNECEDELGAVKLCSLDATCRRILEITRLARRFEIFDDLESAVGSFS